MPSIALWRTHKVHDTIYYTMRNQNGIHACNKIALNGLNSIARKVFDSDGESVRPVFTRMFSLVILIMFTHVSEHTNIA